MQKSCNVRFICGKDLKGLQHIRFDIGKGYLPHLLDAEHFAAVSFALSPEHLLALWHFPD